MNSLSHIGKSVLIPQLNEPTLFESNMMKLRLCSDVHSGFAANVLLSNGTHEYFTSRAKKAVQQASINQQDVSEMPFPFPPLAEQEAITGLLDGVDLTVAEAKKERDGLQLLKESTADALLTGRCGYLGRENMSNQVEPRIIATDLPMTLYLNQRLTFDLLATLEGGFSNFTTVQTTSSGETATELSGGAQLGISNVFAFLGMQLGGHGSRQAGQKLSESTTENIVHTPVSLLPN